MTEKIMIAGVGGQGIQALGKIIASAALAEGKRITWLPSYGAEMRGGASNCHVIISDEEIGSPFIDKATALLAMSQVGLLKFEKVLQKNGLICLNKSMSERLPERDDIQLAGLYASDIADSLGSARFANMVMLGAYLQLRPILKHSTIVNELKTIFASKDPKLIDLNREALEKGAQSVMD